MAGQLHPVDNHALANALGLGQEIAHIDGGADQFYSVRVYAIPTVVDECQGTVASCPDVDLYISVSTGDLGETPALFRLPSAKGWRFVRWVKTNRQDHGLPMSGLIVRTALPDTNINAQHRARWHSRYYRVRVDSSGASFEETVSKKAQ